ncbi:hypothetical protein OE766_26870 [Pararhizobium sp. YC-54]|uniref:hypothetical protein n=1 Tax=Pararhizobium sp. YC-54 TaxID=2986920 RepID=UPI0021F7FC06|nr:hypothetical protein [Pararhizobium sp. YC-54]MCW0001840.1 hypothetical protein [Pararhizobium sp. YC-54]
MCMMIHGTEYGQAKVSFVEGRCNFGEKFKLRKMPGADFLITDGARQNYIRGRSIDGDQTPGQRWLFLMNFNSLFGHDAQLSGGSLVRILSTTPIF